MHDEILGKEALLAELQNRVDEAGTKAKDLKMSFENLCGILFLSLTVVLNIRGYLMPYFQLSNVESAKSEIDALEEAEKALIIIEGELNEAERVHFFDFLFIPLSPSFSITL